MMAVDAHALAEVEAVGVETLHAGIEMELLALLLPGIPHQPVEEGIAIAFGAFRSGCHEVIYIKKFAPRQILHDGNTSHRFDLARIFEIDQVKAAQAFLLPHTRYKSVVGQVRSQFPHNGQAAFDFGIALGDGYVFHLQELWHNLPVRASTREVVLTSSFPKPC